ncbi:T9SS type A sorting domain-containing protein [Hymenobacter elongatus]|uniref:T9SS type A sorting domain-containing protein n=1 Tax=Hymenobacter elongatus TaxID=877208 RepID=A0A4Z0PLM1_9BACT|nr:T9SS type A sorting domain-containing protein [Hymenobacter elongatus]TGE15531.1 T9SS type A sorting domain-containing protein [Hymenobacter elongatus]
MKQFVPIALTAALLTASFGSFAQCKHPAKGLKIHAAQQQRQHNRLEGRQGTHSGVAARGLQATAVTLPGRRVDHYWDDQTNRWGDGSIETYSYNAQGKPTQIINTDSVTNTPRSKDLLAYNGQGRITQRVQQSWNGSAYENSYRDLYTYDAQGQRIQTIYSYWSSNAWVLGGGYRSVNTYNSAGVLTSETEESLDPTTSIWEPEYRVLYTVNSNNQWSEIVFQEWENGAYVNEGRERNIVWHDWAKRLPTSSESQEWDAATTSWDNAYRYSTTYQPNGSNVTITQRVLSANILVNDDRHTYTNDNFGNEVLHLGENWVNNAWVTDHAYRQLISYTATNEVRRSVEQEYNTTTTRYDNSYLTTFGNFVTLAARRATGLEAATSLYPNPTLTTTTVTVSGLREQGAVQAEVVNTLGQVVETLTLRAQQGTISQQVNLAALPSGVYTLRLHTAEGTIAKRVVKN